MDNTPAAVDGKLTGKKIGLIAYPILISLLMEHLIGLTDTAFLGRVGEVELGAPAIAGVYYLALFMLSFGFSIGTQILIARRNGEKRYPEIGRLFQQGIFFMLLMAGIMFFFSQTWSSSILRPLISSDQVFKATDSYINWRVYGFFFSFTALMFRALYVGITKTKILTLNSLVMVLTNVVLNYLLIFGKLGMPRLGIAGAAIGSSVAELVSVVFFLIYTLRKIDWRKYGLFRNMGFDLRVLWHMLGVSIWTMLQAFISIVTWFLFFIAIEHLGERPLAITNIVRSLSSFIFMIITAFAATGSSLVSNLMGEGRTEEVLPVCRKIIRMCYTLVLPLLAVMAIFPGLFLRIYTDSAPLIAASIPALWVMLSVYLINVPGIVWFNAVSGTGNTRSALGMEILCIVAYMLYVFYVVIYLKADVAVCWTTEHVYGIVMLWLSWHYMQRGKWKHKKI